MMLSQALTLPERLTGRPSATTPSLGRGRTRACGVARLLVELGEAPELVRAEDQVDHAEALFQLLGHVRLLHHAAADRDQQVGVPRLGVDERADVAQHAHLRVLAHGAGVDDYQIGLVLVVGEAVAHELYVAAQLLAVRLVLLAAVGVHKREGAPARGLYALAYLKAYLPLPLKLGAGISTLL